jgi:hypothetical protein
MKLKALMKNIDESRSRFLIILIVCKPLTTLRENIQIVNSKNQSGIINNDSMAIEHIVH